MQYISLLGLSDKSMLLVFSFVYHEHFQNDAELFQKAEGFLPNFARAF